MPASIVLIYSTHPSRGQARRVADTLLSAKLAACCNIIPGVESHYEWQGRRERTAEWVMLSKTTQPQAAAAMDAIRAAHPYTNPAILQISVADANHDFLAWVEQAVKTTR